MANNDWQVIISNQLNEDQDKHEVVEKLAALFKTDADKAAKLLSKPRSIIKDNVDEDTAKKYLAAIRRTGAHCEIVNKGADDNDLPSIIEPVKPQSHEATEGLIRRPEPINEPRDVPLSMIEKAEQDERKTRETLTPYEKVNSALYCPQCGTIRSSENAVCLHCNYDPATVKRDYSGIKRVALIAVAAAVVLAIAAFLALPFYQEYTRRSSIENGLQLAIDTRNHITEFIQNTHFWPNQNLDADLPKQISNDIIESIVITENGAFTVTLREQVTGQPDQTIIFKPNSLKGKLVWNCSGGSLSNEYRPQSCRTR